MLPRWLVLYTAKPRPPLSLSSAVHRYACSGATLFGNKHILSTLQTDPNVLAMAQMFSTASFGALKMYGPQLMGIGRPQVTPLSSQPLRNFLCDMLLVGMMRFATVILGLVSLKYVAVSFTETVKSSAPFFTVIFARLILGERTSWTVTLSLVPVVGGLALCSATELSFNYIGFFAAVLNNCIDCVQNVFSKKLLSTHYNYVNLQFYTSAAALVIQLPVMLYNHAASASPRPRPSFGGMHCPPAVIRFLSARTQPLASYPHVGHDQRGPQSGTRPSLGRLPDA